jgi:RND family efflux transporter MFP subunit
MNAGAQIEDVGRAKRRTSARAGGVLLVLALLAASAAAWGVVSRRTDEAKLAQWTLQRATPTVAVVSPERGAGMQELVLPGDVDAFYTAVVHAQVSGYVAKWYKDIGANVKAGDLLATVDTPEIDQRLAESREQLTKAKANQALAAVTAERWRSLRQSGAVSQQAADEKTADEQAQEAGVAAASANVDRLKALKAFANIVAPFDGVVTQRNIDIGALVSDSTSASSGLFAVADTHEMRVYVKAPQSFAAELHDGMKATLTLPQYAGRKFDATIATTARAIDPRSRTLLVELAAKNEEGALPPGAFAEVHFQIPTSADALRLPASAMIFRDRAVEVATVDSNNRVVMKKIEISRDLGSEVAIASGVSPDDRVIASPLDSLEEGDEVRILGQSGANAIQVGETGRPAADGEANSPSGASKGRAE